jgi:MoaA/NifB/PqqE/SkfB family radical SAM enzyme
MLEENNSKEKHKINIALEITTRCQGNCSHCYLACIKNGTDMSLRDIKKINKKIQQVNTLSKDYEFSIKSITGGDPFIYNKNDKSLFNVIDYLAKFTPYLDIHVSGWNRKPQFLDDLKNKNINYYTSFTTFMPNSKERIRQSISDLEKITDHLVIDIITIDKRREKDYNSLKNMLESLDYKLKDRKFIKNSIIIDVYFKEVFPYGRGENLVKDFPSNNNCSIKEKRKYSYHYLDNQGNLYICSRAGAKYTHPICNFLKDTPEEILINFTLFYNLKIIFNYLEGNTCKICKNKFNSWIKESWLYTSKEFSNLENEINHKVTNMTKSLKKKKVNDYTNSISLAYSYEKAGDLINARNLFLKILDKAKAESNHKYVSEIYKDLSIIDRIEHNLPNAKQKLKKALKIAQEKRIEKTEANVYGNLGVIAFLENNYSSAIKYHKKALYIHKKLKDTKRIIPNLSFLGINNLFLEKNKLAKRYLSEAVKLSLETKYQEGLADTLYYLAICSLKMQDYFKSYIYVFLSLDLYWRIPDLYKLKQSFFFILNLPETNMSDSLVRKTVSSYNILKKLFL